jgi:predicted ATP-binding protein involved in virulence
MRIKELTLHNFRGIKDLHLVFNERQNVIVFVGINGVGKSSILNCTNLLIQYYKMVCKNHDIGTLSWHDYERIMSGSDIHIGADSTNNKIKVTFNGSGDIEWSIAKFKKYGASTSWNLVHQKSYDSIINKSKTNSTNHYFYYLANRQVIESTVFPISGISEILDFKDFSKWFKETEDLENERRLSENGIEYRHPVLAAVRSAVYSLLGEGYNSLTFKRAIDEMTIKKSDREISVELLSDGEKSLLAMVGHLSRQLSEDYYGLNNPLEASAIVLIDEIELHLHPEWQRMIIPRLTKTFPNCQFIVTTHSPQVLSHVDPECIHILDYDGDNVVVKRPENSYGLDSNRILEDILGVSKRPQEIQDRMLELFRSINNNDLASAKEIVKELGDRIGINEPELVKAEATIKRREIIGR